MSIFLNTIGERVLSIAVCDRCKMKRRYAELISDVNSPGLRVCKDGCADDLDPYRLPARAADKIDISYPRPDEPLS